MYQIGEWCEGAIGIADDLTVQWCTEGEHEVYLHKVMELVLEYALVFNLKGCAVKAISIKCFVCIHDVDRFHPNPVDISDMHTIKEPENAMQFQGFLGMITYLTPFIVSLLC